MGHSVWGAGTALLILLLSGCGDQETDSGSSADGPGSSTTTSSDAATQTKGAGAQPWLTADGDTLVTCSGSPTFPASRVAAGGLELEPEGSQEILAALDQMKQDFGIDAPGPLQEAAADAVPWAVMWQESVAGTDQVGILIAEPGATEFDLGTDEYATLEWTGQSWRAGTWSGTCGARLALSSGREWAQVALPDARSGQSETADDVATTDQSEATAGTTIDVLVSEIECTGARDPEPFLGEPVVIETVEAVTVFWTTEAMTGDATCPGNPWVPKSVQLEQPLGDRDLLDGSTYPAQLVRTVEEIQGGPPA